MPSKNSLISNDFQESQIIIIKIQITPTNISKFQSNYSKFYDDEVFSYYATSKRKNF